MDRVEHEEFKGGDESIEDWLDGFEAKMEAMDLRTDVRKVKWCKAKIGSAGLQVLKGIEPIASWDQARTELVRYFGDEDVVETAWRNLEFYHGGSKSMGEIAADIDKYARKASREEHTKQRLAVRAFINAMPRKIGDRMKEKKITTLKKALEEAKYLQTIQEEADRNRHLHKLDIEEDDTTPLEVQQQSFQPRGTMVDPQRSRRYQDNGYRRVREIECWACKQKGHFARECTLWLVFVRQRRQEEPREQRKKPQENGGDKDYHLNW